MAAPDSPVVDLSTCECDCCTQYRTVAAQVQEMYDAYQVIKPAIEQVAQELSQGGLVALIPALMAGMRGGR